MTENRADLPVDATPGALPSLLPGDLDHDLASFLAAGYATETLLGPVGENGFHAVVMAACRRALVGEADAAQLRKGLRGLLYLLPEDVFSLRDPRRVAWSNCLAFCRAALEGPKEKPPR